MRWCVHVGFSFCSGAVVNRHLRMTPTPSLAVLETVPITGSSSVGLVGCLHTAASSVLPDPVIFTGFTSIATFLRDACRCASDTGGRQGFFPKRNGKRAHWGDEAVSHLGVASAGAVQ